jgi:chromosome segregation ATPase
MLVRMLPDIAHEQDQLYRPDIPDMLDRLTVAWRTEIGQGRARQYQLEMAQAKLQQTVTDLEKEVGGFKAARWPERVERLNQQIQQLRAECEAAHQAAAEAQRQLQQAKQDFATRQRRLETELDRTDGLVVKYEAQTHQQKAKM